MHYQKKKNTLKNFVKQEPKKNKAAELLQYELQDNVDP